MVSNFFRVLVCSFVLFGTSWAQDTPTYTTTHSFRKWLEGEYPTADSISANWDELDSILALKANTSSLQQEPDSTYAFKMVPEGIYSHTASVSFGASLNDSVHVAALYLERPIRLGKVGLATQTLGGSCGVRGFTVAAYSRAGALIDTTAFITWPGNGTGASGTFQTGASIGPGLVYIAFVAYNDGSCTQPFRGPILDSNTIFSGVLAVQNATTPIFGYASTNMSAGAGWPSTITVSKATTTFLFPSIVLIGTNLD